MSGPTMRLYAPDVLLTVMQVQVLSQFLAQNLWPKATPETEANSHCVMLNDRVSACWSPIYMETVILWLRGTIVSQ